VSGGADPALLDSYEAERLPVAEALLSTTDRFFQFVVSDARFVGLLRTRLLPRVLSLAMRFEGMQKLAFRTISQTGIRYRESPLSQSPPGLPKSAPRAGDRFPWLRLKLSDGSAKDLFDEIDDTRFTLVLIGQPAPAGAAAGGLVRTLPIPAGPENDAALAHRGVPKEAFYLVRPDGYIGLCGGRLESSALMRYLSERLRMRLPAAVTADA
jgi:hypothetical protein